MLGSQTVAAFALLSLLSLTSGDHHHIARHHAEEYGSGGEFLNGGCWTDPLPYYTYTFDPEYAAGVSGEIKVQYAGPFSTFAKISAKLDFSDVELSELTAFDGNCTSEVTEYKWHIHVKWPGDYGSESLEECGLAVTGNHYDPLKACGPNSEFVGTEDCLLKTPEYNCNLKDYKKDPLVCEKGDLSGKFGALKLNKRKKVKAKWYDANFPLPEETTPHFNIILHAVCGKATPRVACAVVEMPPVICA
ncbi:hypothetical protein BBJ28_00012729 [Nothophytophthora sp. Chile5]|nr:hypothetical protein BBJ28_00012729 [Nothophytophthora sp. Chile5]